MFVSIATAVYRELSTPLQCHFQLSGHCRVGGGSPSFLGSVNTAGIHSQVFTKSWAVLSTTRFHLPYRLFSGCIRNDFQINLISRKS